MQGKNFVVGVQCRQLIETAVEKHLPATITNRAQSRWQVGKSSFLAVKANRIILAQPVPKVGETPLEPADGQEVAITFKKGYHKCLYTTRIVGRTAYDLEDGTHTQALISLWPQQIEKIQRRAYNRAPAPAEPAVTVSLWPVSESDPKSQHKYHGSLSDLSAGGLGVIVPPEQVPLANEGQQFELWFVPLPGHEPLCLPASFRHATALADGKGVMLGFQLVGLELSEEGRGLLRWLGRIANVYLRQQQLCQGSRSRRR